MKKVERSEILDYVTYGEQRDAIRDSALAAKRPRRIHVGEHLTFLFENSETIRYQVQEMIRAERIVKESSIQHELETYNGLLGEAGELGCALLIEITDEAERAKKLTAWLELPKHLVMILEDGTEVPASYDVEQVGDDRLSSVQYLKFAPGVDATPVAIAVKAPADAVARAELTADQREALTTDLRS